MHTKPGRLWGAGPARNRTGFPCHNKCGRDGTNLGQRCVKVEPLPPPLPPLSRPRLPVDQHLLHRPRARLPQRAVPFVKNLSALRGCPGSGSFSCSSRGAAALTQNFGLYQRRVGGHFLTPRPFLARCACSAVPLIRPRPIDCDEPRDASPTA